MPLEGTFISASAVLRGYNRKGESVINEICGAISNGRIAITIKFMFYLVSTAASPAMTMGHKHVSETKRITACRC